MSSVILKKIINNHGIPPKVLRFQDFWDNTLLSVESWFDDHFQTKTGIEMLSRQVVSGKEARRSIDGNLTYIFSDPKFSGLCLVAVNRSLAEAFAAKRLNENQDNLADISDIFLSLICERVASQLWESAAFKLLDKIMEAPQPSTSDFGSASGGFSKSSRYLLMTYSLPLPGGGKELQMIFSLQSVRDLLAKYEYEETQSALQSRDQGGLQSSFLSSRVKLNAVLDRLPLTLGDCLNMEPGQTFELPNVSGRKVALAIDTFRGHQTIAEGQAGAWRKHRAVKLSTAIEPDFARGMGMEDFEAASSGGA